jgi:hypothetical protein
MDRVLLGNEIFRPPRSVSCCLDKGLWSRFVWLGLQRERNDFGERGGRCTGARV